MHTASVKTISVLATLMLCLCVRPAGAADEGKGQPDRAGQPATRPAVSAVTDLLQQRVAAAEEAMRLAEKMRQSGVGTFDDLALWSQRWLQARLEAAATRADRLAILREYVDLAKARERDAEARVRAGVSSPLDVQAARYFRIDAELRLSRRLADAGEANAGRTKAGNAKPPGQADKDLLQGAWKVVRKVKDGEAEDVSGNPIVLRFSGETVTQSRGGREKESEGTFAVDPSATPKRITLTGKTGESAGRTFEAIYELDGGTLKLAFGTGDNAAARPKDFTGGEGTGLLVLERQKE